MRRFEIDASARSHHGALLDAELLARVYLELKGGRQQGLGFGPEPSAAAGDDAGLPEAYPVRDARPHEPTPEELAAHDAFLDRLEDPIWRRG
jgi:DNA polymerase-3 subunit epsilon